jgi:hypothetical protein
MGAFRVSHFASYQKANGEPKLLGIGLERVEPLPTTTKKFDLYLYSRTDSLHTSRKDSSCGYRKAINGIGGPGNESTVFHMPPGG